MPLTEAHTHDELLTLARKMEAAAADGDQSRLEAATVKLFDALREHIGAERPDLRRLPPPEARHLAEGQRRVLDELAALTAGGSSPGLCDCAARAADVVAGLYLQAADEYRALGHLAS